MEFFTSFEVWCNFLEAKVVIYNCPAQFREGENNFTEKDVARTEDQPCDLPWSYF